MKALIIVDVQNDFCEGGALGVDGGNAVAARVAQLASQSDDYAKIVTTQDWHINPGKHFAKQPNFQTTWPRHCVVGTEGAELHPEIVAGLWNVDAQKLVTVQKGQYGDAYSGFEGEVIGEKANLENVLRQSGITDVDIVGIATDYCVKATAEDALNAGFEVTVLKDYVAGVAPETSEKALTDLTERGVTVA